MNIVSIALFCTLPLMEQKKKKKSVTSYLDVICSQTTRLIYDYVWSVQGGPLVPEYLPDSNVVLSVGLHVNHSSELNYEVPVWNRFTWKRNTLNFLFNSSIEVSLLIIYQRRRWSWKEGSIWRKKQKFIGSLRTNKRLLLPHGFCEQ